MFAFLNKSPIYTVNISYITSDLPIRWLFPWTRENGNEVRKFFARVGNGVEMLSSRSRSSPSLFELRFGCIHEASDFFDDFAIDRDRLNNFVILPTRRKFQLLCLQAMIYENLAMILWRTSKLWGVERRRRSARWFRIALIRRSSCRHGWRKKNIFRE